MERSNKAKFVIATVALLCASAAGALDRRLALAQYKHSRWTAEDGAPIRITAMAQARNGYLWLATGTGVYRFDGVTFEKIARPRGDADFAGKATALRVTRSGDVWVGYASGALAIYRGGRLRPMADKEPSPIAKIVETPDGTIWVSNGRTQTLARYVAGRREQVGAGQGFFPQYVSDLYVTRAGDLWIAGWGAIQTMPRGAHTLKTIVFFADGGNSTFAQDSQDRLWLMQFKGLQLLANGGKVLSEREGLYAGFETSNHLAPRFIFDRDGNVWGSTQEKGIFRLQPSDTLPGKLAPQEIERFGVADTLTSESATAFVEGREGEIWVGTASGLDRFRTPAIVHASNVPTPTVTPFTDRWGTLFLADDDRLYREELDGRFRQLARGFNYKFAQCDRPDGTHWMATGNGTVQWKGNVVSYGSRPADSKFPTFGCAVDDAGRQWLTAQTRGIFEVKGANRVPVNVPGIDGELTAPYLIRPGGGNRFILALVGMGIVRTDGERVERLWDGKAIGTITAFGPSGTRFLIGGSAGLAQWDSYGFHSLTAERYPWLSNVQGVTTSATDIWLTTQEAVVRIALPDFDRALKSPGIAVPHRVYDRRDGLPGTPEGDADYGLGIGRDGRVWLGTADGPAWIDPTALVGNVLPPPVSVSAVVANGVRYLDPHVVMLPPGSAQIEIDYTAASLLLPERVAFRYRLDGVDPGWVDPGGRRQSFYTNLAPGDYRFQVIAANDEGVWNRTGASVMLHIPPTFLQSVWFKLLCGLGIAILLWLAYHLRVRQLTANVQGRVEACLSERERIARELHDTLLQGFNGLVLRLQAVANLLPDARKERQMLEEALDRADDILIEGRDRVHHLRSQNANDDIGATLLATLKKNHENASLTVTATTEGTVRPLNAGVAEEALSLGEEALRNVVRHARAAQVEIVLVYSEKQFQMTIADDGIGFEPAAIDTNGTKRRYGLIGMRERAVRIGGMLDFITAPQAGTRVMLKVPARSAYPRRRRGGIWALLPGQRP